MEQHELDGLHVASNASIIPHFVEYGIDNRDNTSRLMLRCARDASRRLRTQEVWRAATRVLLRSSIVALQSSSNSQ